MHSQPTMRRVQGRKPNRQRLLTSLLITATLGLVAWKALKNHRSENSSPQTSTVESITLPAGSFKLVRAIDGDTIVVADPKGEFHVRLLAIDAPEKNQPYGAQATTMAISLIGQKPITLKGSSKDRYGRLLAHVHAGETWVNMEMVQRGAAWVYKAKPDTFWADLNEAEREARTNKRGLWAEQEPIYPGDWRKR
jgi:micrococcal nuclease